MSTISKGAALRVSQAARALAEEDPSVFIISLGAYIGLPITEEKLQSLSVEDLARILSGDDGQLPENFGKEHLKHALHLLWGEQKDNNSAPEAENEPAAMAGGKYLQVAVASNNATQLDGHFGTCLRFLIYRVSAQGFYLAEVREANEIPQGLEKNEARAALLKGCELLYVQSIGGPAAAKVVRAGVHPVKFPKPQPASEALEKLQANLDNPPPWLARSLGQASSLKDRFGEETHSANEEVE